MSIHFEMLEGNIVYAEEEAIIVPCSIKAEGIGAGVDGAIYSVFPEVRKAWEEIIWEFYDDKIAELGDVHVVEEYGKRFILVAVPPLSEKSEFRCNLETCYYNALVEASRLRCTSVATPLLGTGGLNWPLNEAYFALYNIIYNDDSNKISVKNITLYLKDKKAIEYAEKNNWDIKYCFDKKVVEERITMLVNQGYVRYECRELEHWYSLKEQKKPKLEKKKHLEADICFKFSVIADYQLHCINEKANKKLKKSDIVERSGLLKNNVSYIFSGNPRYSFDKDSVLAFGYAMQCSYDQICECLNMHGFCFTDSERDEIIIEVFKSGEHYDVRYLNEILKLHNQPPLNEKDFRTEKIQFAMNLEEQISYVSSLSGSTFTNVMLAERSGLTPNAISEIRKASSLFIPEKDKIIALAIALRCHHNQVCEWLKLFGMAFSDSYRDSLIADSFKLHLVANASELNSRLLEYGQERLKVTAFKPGRDRDKDY